MLPIKRLMAKGMVEKIRNNLYTCVSGETNAPLANRYQIASAITPTAYVSHHTAMEYYGANDQMYYDVYVSSKTEFKDFEKDFENVDVPCVLVTNRADKMSFSKKVLVL